MTEELNQVQDELEVSAYADEEGLFDDYTEEETTDTVKEKNNQTAEDADPAVETKKVETTNTPFSLKVKYNGEEKELNEEDARTFSQKGMNYDSLLEKYNNEHSNLEKYSSEHGELERLAKMNGMTVDSFIQSLSDTQIQYEINKEAQNLKNQNPDTPDAIINELAQRRVNERLGDIQTKEYAQEKERADAQREAVERDIEIVKRDFPDFDESHIPEEVIEYIKQGMNLPTAYFKYQRELDIKNRTQEDAQAKIDKINEENKNKSLGSTTNAGSADEDDFLSGFLKG